MTLSCTIPTHLSPLAAARRERSDCEAIRVRGSHRARRCSEFAEAAPHPNPLGASFARLGPAKSGERGK